MAEKIEVQLLVDTKASQKNVDKFNSSLNKTSVANTKATVSSAKTGAAVGVVGKSSKVAAGSVTTLGGAVGGAAVGFTVLKAKIQATLISLKSMKVALIATGIGALLIGLIALKKAFTGSEEGQNKFAKLMGVIGALTGNLVDLLADLGEGIISAFENPVESLKSFGNLIKENLITRFEGLVNLIPNLGKAIDQLFKGNFREAGKIAADSVGQVVLGVESVTDTVANATTAVKKFTAEQIKEGKAAAEVANMRAKADKIERALIVDRSKLESEIALLRLKSREEEKFSAAERKQALLDAQVLEDQLLDKETEFLELRRDAQIAENTFSRSNKENLTKEAEAIAAVNRQQASRANTARQVQREVNTISKQIEAEEKAAATELDNFKKSLRDAEAVSMQEKRDLELIKIQENYEALILQAEENEANTDQLKLARDAALKAKQKEFDAKDVAQAKIVSDAKIKIAEEEANAKQTALDGYAAALSSISGIIGQETQKGKALAIASTLVNTYAAIAGQLKAFAGIPVPGYAIAQAIATGLVGLASVKKIASVKVPEEPGGGSSQTGSLPAASAPPAFNVVGQGSTSQLADAIGGQANEPVRAYVVSNDVTTAQGLERNIVEVATI
jgi:hypothetical protein